MDQIKIRLQYMYCSGNWYTRYVDSISDLIKREGFNNYRFDAKTEDNKSFSGVVMNGRLIGLIE